MGLDSNQDILDNFRRIVGEKGDSVKADDLLIPELRWVIDCTPLSETDRRFAELRYIQGKKSKDIMEDLGWYSTKTFRCVISSMHAAIRSLISASNALPAIRSASFTFVSISLLL